MALVFLDDDIWFPPVADAVEDGLLAIGGDLRTERLLLAYRSGIFPWFNEDELPMWWSPDPRFVLLPENLKVSKSMKQVLRSKTFDFKTNTDFNAVIRHCQNSFRKDQDGTWITNEIVNAYTKLHKLGFAHCAEAWQDEKLVGGLYGIKIGKVFFGESMFSEVSNASKFAFINYVHHLKEEGIELIDCQVYTTHLESLGAKMISRTDFMERIKVLQE